MSSIKDSPSVKIRDDLTSGHNTAEAELESSIFSFWSNQHVDFVLISVSFFVGAVLLQFFYRLLYTPFNRIKVSALMKISPYIAGHITTASTCELHNHYEKIKRIMAPCTCRRRVTYQWKVKKWGKT